MPDTDKDGFNDDFELQTGYDPTTATSTPDAVFHIRTAIELEFNAANGVSYRIEGSANLRNWVTVETDIIGTGGPLSRLYSTKDTPHRFFRVRRN